MMDRKTLVAIGLSLLVFMGWQKYMLSKYPQPAGAPVTTQMETTASVSTAPATSQQSEVATQPRQTASVTVKNGHVVLTNHSKLLEGWTYSAGSQEISLESLTGAESQIDLALDHPDYARLGALSGNLESRSETEYRWVADSEAARVVREVKFDRENGYADITYTAEFKKSLPRHAFVSVGVSQKQPKNAGEERDRKLIYFAGKKHESLAASEPVKLTDILLPVEWVGVEDRYFMFGLVDRGGIAKGLLQPLATAQNRISLVYPVQSSTVVIPVRIYFGPKSVDLLKQVHPSLSAAVDFGMLTSIAFPILHFMKFLYSFMGNYGLAIILLTIVLKLALYPLTYKSMKSMKKMSELQPQLQKLRDRYADDKEALNREMLSLMRTQGYNPVAGCLPMLVQMPIFFALYRVLYNSFELYRAPFGLWIHDLSAKDPWFITPVLLTGVMYFQQKLTPATATDPAQQKMLQMMPLIFGVFMLFTPSGLAIYMLTNAVVSIIQQLILNKKLGIRTGHGALRAG